jgi:Mn-dependent DtxR family transcriptional regulator
MQNSGNDSFRGAGTRMQSEAVEKYLKTIYEIQQQGGRVKTNTLAQTLGFTAGSVTDMIKRLANLIIYLP